MNLLQGLDSPLRVMTCIPFRPFLSVFVVTFIAAPFLFRFRALHLPNGTRAPKPPIYGYALLLY